MGLLDFRTGTSANGWTPVHDVVMGGRSTGEVIGIEGGVRLRGVVSLENGGGFASFRHGARLPDLTGSLGLRLEVRGDGHVYELGLRTEGLPEGVRWRVPFVTEPGRWTRPEVLFADLEAARRGRVVAGVGPFDPARIVELRLLIGSRQEGPFQLDLASVDAFP